ncbi:MAG: neuromedin U [Bacteroidetes bacterium]|nr:MAG: neuromedin U [Bacteroidota bacterium]
MKTILSVSLTLLSILFVSILSTAQSNEKLAKASQNPVTNFLNFPFQNNTNYGVGPYSRNQNVLNIQPVIPIPLGSKINMINRIILPIITQPSSTEDMSSTGTGDLLYTAWLSPAKAGKVIWGLGPVLQLPTSSGSEFGSGEFGIGPSVVLLTMLNKWVAGAVINNIRTFGEASTNKFFINYFINYNMSNGLYLVSAPIVTANWNAEENQKWLVPFGGGIGKVVKLGGKLPVSIQFQTFYNVIKPDALGDWQTRFQLHFMFPTKSMKEKMKAAN